MNTLSEAVGLLAAERMLMLAPHAPLRSLVEEIGGRGTKGTWWAHAKGGLIFNISSDLSDHPDTLVVKLVAGKVTFVHRSLWPVLLRVTLDPTRQAEKLSHLSPEALRLFERIAIEGTVRPEKSHKAARLELEKSLLVLSQSVHTERGNHETSSCSWEHWARLSSTVVSPGTLAESIDELAVACRGAKLSF